MIATYSVGCAYFLMDLCGFAEECLKNTSKPINVCVISHPQVLNHTPKTDFKKSKA